MFIVEVIRTLAEFVVYAEKYRKTGHSQGSNYFDILKERTTFEHFSRILDMNNRFVSL
jgi:hypothetical protein